MTESKLMLRLCCDPGKSQLDTREKDFFFLRGGRSTKGRGGGGGISSRLGREGGVEGDLCSPGVRDLRGGVIGVLTGVRGDLMGAVCGLSMISELRRWAKEGAAGGRAGIDGMGSRFEEVGGSGSSPGP